MSKTKSILTKDEEKKLTGSVLKLMSDLSTIKTKILQNGKKTKAEIRFVKNILKLYTLTKKNTLDDQIYFPFTDVTINDKSPAESEMSGMSETESVDYDNMEFTDCSETDSNYSFSQADENENEMVRKVMTFGFVNLLNARESKGFNISKQRQNNYDTDIIHFKFDETPKQTEQVEPTESVQNVLVATTTMINLNEL